LYRVRPEAHLRYPALSSGPLRRFENAAFVETYDPHFAAWLREHARSARIEELPAR
jgi:hypothetical protein